MIAVQSSDRATIIHPQDGSPIMLRPYLYVLPGDVLEFHPSKANFTDVYKLTQFSSSNAPLDKVRIYPPYSQSCWVHVPPHRFLVTFRERQGPSDLRATRALEQFHYRGKGLNRLIGRRTVLIADSHDHGVIGYGVLSATLGAAKPRFALFKTNFTQQMRTKLINRLVRIPRVVIHPEFRGMGLGAIMAKNLVDFARSYWDVRGYTPIAVEVIASMTQYHRFFEAAGFVRAGQTLGYKEGITPLYGTGSWAQRPNSMDYDFLRDQKPKPYLIYPLNTQVRGALMDSGWLHAEIKRLETRPNVRGHRISFRRVGAQYKVTNGLSSRAEQVRAAFDVDARQLQSPILTDCSFDIDPGDAVLITGASGSGKSTILALLTHRQEELEEYLTVQGAILGADPAQIARLATRWDDSLPLVDQVGASVKEAIEILNGVGLAEAHLYVKNPSQISDGQRYRFAVALLCDSKRALWVADEFASSLDPLTAAIVAKGIRKQAYHSGATIVVAASHFDNFVDSLIPNKLVTLRWGSRAEVLSIKCQFKVHADSVHVLLKNTSKRELTGTEVLGMTIHGQRQVVAKIGTLQPRTGTQTVELPLDHIQRFNGLVVFTHQHVGDVLYFGHSFHDESRAQG